MLAVVVAVVAAECLSVSTAKGVEPFRIRIVDEQNNWPVPLVELRTTHNVSFVSDNTGQIAFDLPELMGVETWFHLEGHGYTVPADGFGMRGARLTPRPGATHTIRVKRVLAAKRLGRITGAGIFAESQKLGENADWQEQRILGCDSVQNAQHNGRLFWGWGDTVLAHYPLGRFHMIGATTKLQPLKRFEPPIRLRYGYFKDEQNVPRNVAQMPGDGPTWLSGYVSLPDNTGNDRLVATYSKIEPPLAEYERGLCVWNEAENRFDQMKVLWRRSEQSASPPAAPIGHVVVVDEKGGTRSALFGDPFPELKCEATFEAWSDPERWERLEPQQFVPAKNSDAKIKAHRGAIAWNDYREKWVSIFTQMNGQSSTLGEIWYAEAASPTGPWSNAIEVVTHNKYTFYNPQLHSEFTPSGSPILLFEATYTHTFSKTETPTPRHDYNQVLYRLDLNELPQPEHPPLTQ